jgi:signal transduction histidine kinase
MGWDGMINQEARRLITEARDERTQWKPIVNILLVDDVPANLMALGAVLENPDYNLVTASSGEEALRCILKDEFALILMDVQMPEMDGFETASIIKKREQSRYIPIIFVTATSKEDSAVCKGYDAGAIDYLFKPVDAHILRSKVEVFVELYLSKKMLEHKNALLEQQAAELELANQRLLEADRHKDEFLGVISHELRTPLNFITGFASVLDDGLQGPLTPAQQRSVGKILEGSERMLHLVDDLLDLSKMQAGRLILELSPTPIAPLVQQAIEDYRQAAAARHLILTADVRVSQAPCLDGARFRQALNNLLSNAVKFTPTGGKIVVRAVQAADEMVIEVEDTGIGIASDDFPKLFLPFQQLDMSATRAQGGTGLGLAITKVLVEAHGGTITVRSQVGHGTTFSLVFPLGSCEPSP